MFVALALATAVAAATPAKSGSIEECRAWHPDSPEAELECSKDARHKALQPNVQQLAETCAEMQVVAHERNLTLVSAELRDGEVSLSCSGLENVPVATSPRGTGG